MLAHCVVCALLTQAAYADVSDAGIQGEVRSGQAAGQIIEATNLNTGRVTSTRTQADGHFILNGLAPVIIPLNCKALMQHKCSPCA